MKWVLIVVGALLAIAAIVAVVGSLISRTHQATSVVTIHQPPDSVWKAVRDLGSIPAWWTEVKTSERLPDQGGLERWNQKLSNGFDLPLEITEAVAPTRLVTLIVAEDSPFGGRWIYELSPVAGGTRVSITEDGWISNVIFRFMSKFVMGYYATLDKYLTALGKKFGEDVTPVHQV